MEVEDIKHSMEGMDTFNCIFLGVDLAEWFELRKEAKSAGQLDGKSLFLKDDESQVASQNKTPCNHRPLIFGIPCCQLSSPLSFIESGSILPVF